MKNEEKKQISDALRGFAEVTGSQKKASVKLNVSQATVSEILNGNWDLISDEMWLSIAASIGVKDSAWSLVQTRTYNDVTRLLQTAKDNSMTLAMVGSAGTGKTAAMKHFAQQPNSYHIACESYWNRKNFLSEILRQLGREYQSYSVAEMVNEITTELKKKVNPILMIDEADKIQDDVLNFFITFYNRLEDVCAIVLCATNHLEKKVKNGVQYNKRGYNEIFSRVGRKFVPLKGVSDGDVKAICEANGITDSIAVAEIIKDADGDIRRVKNKVKAIKAIKNGKNEEK